MRSPAHGILVVLCCSLVALGCGETTSSDKAAEPAPKAADKAPADKPAADKPDKPPEKNQREADMAKKVVAALASGDYAKMDALTSDLTRRELGDINQRSFRELREALRDAEIDLAAATFNRVEVSGDQIKTVDVFLDHGDRTFYFHFNVMTLGGKFDYTGHSVWFKWVDEK